MQPYDLVSTLMPDTAEIYALHEQTEEEQPQACRLKYTCMCVYEFICKHTHTRMLTNTSQKTGRALKECSPPQSSISKF